MKLSIHLVTWNGAKYISPLFESLRGQTFRDWSLRIWDNDSADGTVVAIKKELENFTFEYEIIENGENIGFAGGHNALINNYVRPRLIPLGELIIANYTLLLNQDLYLMPDCLEKMVSFMDRQLEVAVVSPRLMKWDFSCHPERSPKDAVEATHGWPPDRVGSHSSLGLTDVIDSLGLKVFRNRRVVEQFAGRKWSTELRNQLTEGIAASLSAPRNDAFLSVFGVSGTMPMLRTEVIGQIKFADGTFFDQSYHSYKEDVDLAYRLNSVGFNSAVLLDAVAHHDRSATGPSTRDDATALKNKKTQSEWVKYNSYKNHLMTLYKNEYWQNFALDFLAILWYELKKFGYFLLFDRKVLGGWKEVFMNRHELKIKRKQIISKRKMSWKEMRGKLRHCEE